MYLFTHFWKCDGLVLPLVGASIDPVGLKLIVANGAWKEDVGSGPCGTLTAG